MHTEAHEFVKETAPSHKLDLVIELGSRDVNGGVRKLFDANIYIGVDTRTGEGVDVMADAAAVSFHMQADVVVSTETLEHCADPAAFVRNAYKLLKPGGTFILTTAGERRVPHSAIDGMTPREGEPYQNITPDELREWWPEPELMTVILARGGFDVYAVAGKEKQ